MMTIAVTWHEICGAMNTSVSHNISLHNLKIHNASVFYNSETGHICRSLRTDHLIQFMLPTYWHTGPAYYPYITYLMFTLLTAADVLDPTDFLSSFHLFSLKLLFIILVFCTSFSVVTAFSFWWTETTALSLLLVSCKSLAERADSLPVLWNRTK